ncbi:DUF1589 domain-containing protein [Rhodopirellula sp. P2]|uniref:DUF1589 domain-containing protein n=1 Tax=Rhodopirellula sp. P2 TaxID=2127060 RepID=UPI003FCF7DB7
MRTCLTSWPLQWPSDVGQVSPGNQPMLWNKARRPATPARSNTIRPITQPGGAWPTNSPSLPR